MVMLRSAAVVYRTFSYTDFFAPKKSFVYDRQRPQHQFPSLQKVLKISAVCLEPQPFYEFATAQVQLRKTGFLNGKVEIGG